jgi:Mn2+/Fe2+ NRAMP family transporter
VGINPIKALFLSAVINGVVAAPIMAMVMLLAANPKAMGTFTLPMPLKVMGWLATAVMLIASVGMFLTLGK